jgi:hypothetical protein
MRGNDGLVWQLGHLRFSEWRSAAAGEHPPERAEEKRKHLLDGRVYILLDEPRFTREGRLSEFKAMHRSTGPEP